MIISCIIYHGLGELRAPRTCQSLHFSCTSCTSFCTDRLSLYWSTQCELFSLLSCFSLHFPFLLLFITDFLCKAYYSSSGKGGRGFVCGTIVLKLAYLMCKSRIQVPSDLPTKYQPHPVSTLQEIRERERPYNRLSGHVGTTW